MSITRQFDEFIQNLEQLQTQYPQINQQKPVAKEKNEDVEELGGCLQNPPGTKDYGPGDMIIRDKMMTIIKNEFKKMGCAMLETPIMENKETLCGNYGENEDEIFHLADQGGVAKALRYDHTVPLARYIAMNRKSFTKTLRAARIGRVYRMDKPNATQGRMREFYQCDLDIVRAGSSENPLDLVIDDVEVLHMACAILTELVGRDNFLLRCNNRKIFDCVLSLYSVSEEQFKSIGSAVDKLDKRTKEEVQAEMIQKGLTPEQAAGILHYTDISGSPAEMIETMRKDKKFMSVEGAPQVLEEMSLLYTYLEAYGWCDKCHFDMKMVRGLHYYTGMIFEGELTDPIADGIGSICGGGRYNDLVNKFIKGDQFPCTGGSIGFERVFSYLKMRDGDITAKTCTQVLIGELGGKGSDLDLLPARIRLLQELRAQGICTENYPKNGPRFGEQIEYAESWKIPFFCFFGETELANKTVQAVRKVYPGDEVELKNGRRGTMVSLEGKFYHIKNQKGKVEKMKKTNAKFVVTASGSLCSTNQQEVSREELAAFIKTNL